MSDGIINIDAADNFLNDLDTGEIDTLIRFVTGIDRLEMKDGQPRWDSETIDLIGRFQDADLYFDESNDGDIEDSDGDTEDGDGETAEDESSK
jgi:hypothetical protein